MQSPSFKSLWKYSNQHEKIKRNIFYPDFKKSIENKTNECYSLLKFKIDVCCFNLCVFIYQTLSNIQNTPKTYLININNQNGHRI